MRTCQRRKLADKTSEEKEARLQQTRTCQHERLATKTTNGRDARMQCDRERHRELRAVHPQVQQHSVRTKMRKFHAHMALLNVSRCSSVQSDLLPASLFLTGTISDFYMLIVGVAIVT